MGSTRLSFQNTRTQACIKSSLVRRHRKGLHFKNIFLGDPREIGCERVSDCARYAGVVAEATARRGRRDRVRAGRPIRVESRRVGGDVDDGVASEAAVVAQFEKVTDEADGETKAEGLIRGAKPKPLRLLGVASSG